MAEYQIPISYVVTATAVTPQQGLSPLKLSTIAIFTDEEPVQAMTEPYMIARTSSAVINAFGSNSETAAQAQIIFSQQPNILANNGYVIIAPFNNTPADEETETEAVQETLSAAITRLKSYIYFEGILTTRNVTDEEFSQAALTVQANQNQVMPLPRSDVSALTGIFTQTQSYSNTKNLLYLTGDTEEQAAYNSRMFAAAYLSRGLAVNYSGSNTTLTINLKDLAGIQADTQISETILNQCETVGVDCFPSIEGLAKIVSFSQGGQYFDEVTNQIWLVNTIQREVFNTLATVGGKIAQTDPALEIITKTIRGVCEQAVINGMAAPGVWNSADTFGDYDDFHRNISEFGYYIYHQSVTTQSQTERENRQAPLYQIAVKLAGAVHRANVIIRIEP